MKVKELIELLSKCNPEYTVVGDYGELGSVVEHINHGDPESSNVEIV